MRRWYSNTVDALLLIGIVVVCALWLVAIVIGMVRLYAH
jgi:hypothetical protein